MRIQFANFLTNIIPHCCILSCKTVVDQTDMNSSKANVRRDKAPGIHTNLHDQRLNGKSAILQNFSNCSALYIFREHPSSPTRLDISSRGHWNNVMNKSCQFFQLAAVLARKQVHSWNFESRAILRPWILTDISACKRLCPVALANAFRLDATPHDGLGPSEMLQSYRRFLVDVYAHEL
jgi:hypothetical protein